MFPFAKLFIEIIDNSQTKRVRVLKFLPDLDHRLSTKISIFTKGNILRCSLLQNDGSACEKRNWHFWVYVLPDTKSKASEFPFYAELPDLVAKKLWFDKRWNRTRLSRVGRTVTLSPLERELKLNWSGNWNGFCDRNYLKTKKKVFTQKWSGFCIRNYVKTKQNKKFFNLIWSGFCVRKVYCLSYYCNFMINNNMSVRSLWNLCARTNAHSLEEILREAQQISSARRSQPVFAA